VTDSYSEDENSTIAHGYIREINYYNQLYFNYIKQKRVQHNGALKLFNTFKILITKRSKHIKTAAAAPFNIFTIMSKMTMCFSDFQYTFLQSDKT